MKNQTPETNQDLIDFATACGNGRIQAKTHNINLYNVQDIGRTVNGGVKPESLKGWNNSDAQPTQDDNRATPDVNDNDEQSENPIYE
jgi:hypothetical protein